MARATAASTRTRTASSSATGTARRTWKAPVRRKVSVLPQPRVVEDDLEVLAAEHAERDAALLDLVARLVA